MPRFRTIPVEVEAVRCSAALHWAAHDWDSLPEWLREAYELRTS